MIESMRRTAGPEVLARSSGIKVEIQKHCLDKIHGWCNAAKSEVSGMGLVTLKNGVFHVSEVFLPEQRCSSGYTLIESEAMGRLMYSLHTRKRDSFDLRFWWHTHYTFGTFWSGTDDDQAQQLCEENGEWSLSLVVNQAGSRLCRTDFKTPIPIMVDKLPITEVNNIGKVSKRDYQRDINRWVKPLHDYKERKEFVWTDRIVSNVIPLPKTNYIVHGGKLMTLEQYRLALECVCNDGTCPECKESLRINHESKN